MDILNTNFEENFGLIKEAIENASFISIDTEFTGLEDIKSKQIHQFDTQEERYFKLYKAAKKYIIIQFGICAFKYSEENDCFNYTAFNFYIFPRKFKDGPDSRFLCQSSSLEYLANHNFDFDKVIKHGICYMLPRDERKILELYSSQDFFETTNKPVIGIPIEVPDMHKSFVERMIEKTEELVNNKKNGSINLDPCCSYVRKSLYEQLLFRFSKNIFLETKTSVLNEKYIQVTYSDDLFQLKHSLGQQKRREAMINLDKAIGFTRVIKLIQESKKLMIGHNMMLDLMHMIQQFCEPLPTDYKEFKSLIRVLFPRIMDTKLIAVAPELKDVAKNFNLEELYISLKSVNEDKKIKIVPVDDMYHYEDRKCFHNAGYDAYVTGVCFILMAKYLSNNKRSNNLMSNFHHLSSFENKIYLMKSIDMQHIDLDGPDVLPVRDHVFYIQFVKDKKLAVKDLFTAFGNVQIKFLNDETALISYYNKTHAINATSLLNIRDSWFKVITYDQYVKNTNLEINELPSRKRKLIESDKVYNEQTTSNTSHGKSKKSINPKNKITIQVPDKKPSGTCIFDVPEWNP